MTNAVERLSGRAPEVDLGVRGDGEPSCEALDIGPMDFLKVTVRLYKATTKCEIGHARQPKPLKFRMPGP